MESLSRTAEKLIILLDYSNGLLTRVHGVKNYRKGPVFAELQDNYVKLIDHLGQKKEDPTIGVTRQAGSEVIQMRSEALENETRFCYETIADILLFTNEVEPLFHTLCANIMVFDIHKNSDLTTRFLGVFFNYVKIYWLISRISDGRIACYLYMLAYKEHQRQEPDEAHLVKKFIFDNYSHLKQIQGRLSDVIGIGEAIQSAIECVRPSFQTWTSYDALQQGQYFSLSQENPLLFSHPIDEKTLELYMDASHLDNIGTWILYLYLVFPEMLEEEKAREQVAAALNDRTVVILYRDELVDAMLEYSQLQKTCMESLKIPKQHVSRLLKSVKMDDVTQRHRQMRRLLRREIRGILDLTQALPGVIPVKLPMLMACLALSRYEIFWVFTHMSLTDSRYKLKDSSIAAPYLPDLMFHCMKLLELILNARDLIHLYYKEQLKLDLQALIPFAQQMRKLAKVDVEVLDNVDHIITQINDLGSNKQVKSLEGLRLNWYRASASLSKEPSVLKKPEGHAMAALMNPLIEHTRYFDRLDKEVDARGSMAQLWFYRSFMAQIFNNYCLGKDDTRIESPIRQGRYWVVFLQVFSQALLNVHRQRPEEMDQIGISALSKAEAYLNGATSRIEVSLRNVLGQHSKWNSQIEPSTVADHLIANDGRRRGWKQLPGFESFYQNKEVLLNLKSNLDTIGDMCASFAEIPSIIIANQRLFPAAYLYQLMHDFFYQELRLLVQENQRTMVRPTRFVSRLERLFKACSRIGNYINLDSERMIKQLLYYDFYDDSVGIVGGALGMPRKKDPAHLVDGNTTGGTDQGDGGAAPTSHKKLLIHDIRDWYVGIVDSRCAAPGSGAVYSPILDGFYDYNSNQACPIEDYCSLTELEALCQIIGPAGVRVIDIEIVKIGHSAMQKIATAFAKNKDLIYSIEMEKFYDIDRWLNVCKRFSGLDVISRQGVVVGSVIIFRRLLRKALRNVVKRRVPFIGDTVKEIHNKLYKESMYYEAFSHLGLDCGIMSNFTDNVMRNVFYQLAMDDSKIWSYIPLVFGICFANESFWDNGRYSMKLGALKNNGFALANAVDTLITIFSEKSQHRKNKLMFLDITARTLLYRKKSQPSKQSVNELFLFIDYFIDVANDITQNDLQHFSVPYDVLRAQLVKAYGDASGFYSNATLQNMDDDEKNAAPSGTGDDG